MKKASAKNFIPFLKKGMPKNFPAFLKKASAKNFSRLRREQWGGRCADTGCAANNGAGAVFIQAAPAPGVGPWDRGGPSLSREARKGALPYPHKIKHPPQVRACLKIEELPDFSQTAGEYKAKNTGIL